MIWNDTKLIYEGIFPDPERAPEPSQYQPASVDLRLSGPFISYSNIGAPLRVDMGKEFDASQSELAKIHEGDTYLLRPGGFVLAQTFEAVKIPKYAVGRVEGRSSVGRLGLCVHVTAGFLDPGFHGSITLELSNLGPFALMLTGGSRICQVTIQSMVAAARAPYGKDINSAYQGQSTTTQSRYRP